MTDYRRGFHSVSSLYAHLVFVVKYRRKIFTAEHIEYMREVFSEVGRKMDFRVIEVNGEEETLPSPHRVSSKIIHIPNH